MFCEKIKKILTTMLQGSIYNLLRIFGGVTPTNDNHNYRIYDAVPHMSNWFPNLLHIYNKPKISKFKFFD